MSETSKTLFRKESLENVESPENIHSFVKVINPGVWVALIALAVAVAGLFVWSFFGRIDSTVNVSFRTEGGKAALYIREEDAEMLKRGDIITIGNKTGKIMMVSGESYMAGDVMDDYIIHKNGFEYETWVVEIVTNVTAEYGVNSAKIVEESFSPIQFILGK